MGNHGIELESKGVKDLDLPHRSPPRRNVHRCSNDISAYTRCSVRRISILGNSIGTQSEADWRACPLVHAHISMFSIYQNALVFASKSSTECNPLHFGQDVWTHNLSGITWELKTNRFKNSDLEEQEADRVFSNTVLLHKEQEVNKPC